MNVEGDLDGRGRLELVNDEKRSKVMTGEDFFFLLASTYIGHEIT